MIFSYDNYGLTSRKHLRLIYYVPLMNLSTDRVVGEVSLNCIKIHNNNDGCTLSMK